MSYQDDYFRERFGNDELEYQDNFAEYLGSGVIAQDLIFSIPRLEVDAHKLEMLVRKWKDMCASFKKKSEPTEQLVNDLKDAVENLNSRLLEFSDDYCYEECWSYINLIKKTDIKNICIELTDSYSSNKANLKEMHDEMNILHKKIYKKYQEFINEEFFSRKNKWDEIEKKHSKIQEGFIYVLTHDFIKDTVKLGFTERDPKIRASELSAEIKLPGKFNIEYFTRTKNPYLVEQRVFEKYKEKSTNEFIKESAENVKNEVISVIREMESEM